MPSGVSIKATTQRTKGLGIAAAQALPVAVDLTGNAPTPGNQGSVGSCAAWSIGYTQAGWYAKATGHAGAPFAPMYLYSQTHVNNTPSGGGSYTSANYTIMKNQGIAEQAVYTQGNFNFMTPPTDAQRANAAAHRVAGYSYLFSGQGQGAAAETAIKTALASNKPVGIAIPVYPPFYYLNSTDYTFTSAMMTGAYQGGHAITAVGYDSTGVIIENSWGTNWGKAGFARLSWDFVRAYTWEAAVMQPFVSNGTPPTVTKLSSTRVSTLGGTPLTITGTNLAAVDATSASAVQMVNVADASKKVNATITSSTSSTITVTTPPVSLAGAWRVVLNSAAGTSPDVVADDITYVAPPTLALATTGPIPATGATVSVTGSGFGTKLSTFKAKKITATVNGSAATVSWNSDTRLYVAVKPGTPGTAITIVLTFNGIAAAPLTGLTYGAAVTKATWTIHPTTGARTATLAGTGLASSTAWQLTAPGGASRLTLPAAADRTALAAASAGVVVAGDTVAYVKLPAKPGDTAGEWTLAFTPTRGNLAPTKALRVVYAAPSVKGLSVHSAPAAGGKSVTVKGAGFAAVDLATAKAVALVGPGGSSVAVTVLSRTETSMSIRTPAISAGAWQLRVTSAFGTSADAGSNDNVKVA